MILDMYLNNLILFITILVGRLAADLRDKTVAGRPPRPDFAIPTCMSWKQLRQHPKRRVRTAL